MSQADVIYSHINGNDLQKVDLNVDEVVSSMIKRASAKTLDNAIDETKMLNKIHFEAVMIAPKFIEFKRAKELEFGIDARMWSSELVEQVMQEFTQKYL